MSEHHGMLVSARNVHGLEVVLVKEVNHLRLEMLLATVVMAELAVLPISEGVDIAACNFSLPVFGDES